MSSTRQLFALQQIDLAIEERRAALEKVRADLKENDLVNAARSRYESDKEKSARLVNEQHALDAEVTDLREKLKRVEGDLFGGKKNPKELVDLQAQADNYKNEIKPREDRQLELMTEIENVQARMADGARELAEIEKKWHLEQESLRHNEADILAQMAEFEAKRQAAVALLSHELLALYKSACSGNKGIAVAKVTSGRCQGCRISLSVSELQRARTGNVVNCSNCGRILYVE